MKSSKVITICLVLILVMTVARSQKQNCEVQDYIIPYTALDYAFDQATSTIRGQASLVTLIQDPNA